MRATRNAPETIGDGVSQHVIRIMKDPNRQRVRAVCDRHSWYSEWCYAGPGHTYDPLDGWVPKNSLLERAGELGAVHLRSTSRRRV